MPLYFVVLWGHARRADRLGRLPEQRSRKRLVRVIGRNFLLAVDHLHAWCRRRGRFLGAIPVERRILTLSRLVLLLPGVRIRFTLGTVSVDFGNGLLSQLANAGSHRRQIDEYALNFMLSVITGIKPKGSA